MFSPHSSIGEAVFVNRFDFSILPMESKRKRARIEASTNPKDVVGEETAAHDKTAIYPLQSPTDAEASRYINLMIERGSLSAMEYWEYALRRCETKSLLIVLWRVVAEYCPLSAEELKEALKVERSFASRRLLLGLYHETRNETAQAIVMYRAVGDLCIDSHHRVLATTRLQQVDPRLSDNDLTYFLRGILKTLYKSIAEMFEARFVSGTKPLEMSDLRFFDLRGTFEFCMLVLRMNLLSKNKRRKFLYMPLWIILGFPCFVRAGSLAHELLEEFETSETKKPECTDRYRLTPTGRGKSHCRDVGTGTLFLRWLRIQENERESVIYDDLLTVDGLRGCMFEQLHARLRDAGSQTDDDIVESYMAINLLWSTWHLDRCINYAIVAGFIVRVTPNIANNRPRRACNKRRAKS